MLFTTLFDVTAGDRAGWRFKLFGIPVRVEWFFWLTVLLTCGSRDPGEAVIWAVVCFVSILVHELGHVFAFRYYGVSAEAVLYALGGMAIPRWAVRGGATAQVVISLAGPAAGFVLAAISGAIAMSMGAQIQIGARMLILPTVWAIFPPAEGYSALYKSAIFNDLLWVNFYWGIVNLLPIFPLDGGQAARALLVRHDPFGGLRRSLKVSAGAAIMMALLGIASLSLYMLVVFGSIAAWSIQQLEETSPPLRGTPYGSRKWR